MTTDDQQNAAANMPPPSTLESVRRFWLDFAASVPADTQDIGFVMEVASRALEAIRRKYEAQEESHLANAIKRGEAALDISAISNDMIKSLLQAAQLWGEDVANGVAGCDERAAAGMDTTIRSLLHVCMAQRLRVTHRALYFMQLQMEVHRKVLRSEGSTELVIL